MKPGIILFLGMVRRGEFESLQSWGLPLGVLVDTNNKQKLGDVSKFEVVERFDFSRPLDELIEAVQGIQTRTGIACLFNVIEFYVLQTAEVARALGIANISPASARLCLDKSVMRERFHERIGDGAAARFRLVESEGDLERCGRELGYPLFLQPSNVSASMWSTRNDSLEAVSRNYRQMIAEVPAYYERLGKKGNRLKVVAAEYLEGANTSIDCVVDQSGGVHTLPLVDVLTGKDVGIEDFHHFARVLPSRLGISEQQELAALAVAGVQALDMTSCAAHVEFIGRRLGEIAARPGGNRPRILDMAYGIDELHAYYEVLTGKKPEVTRQKNLAAAIVTPFPRKNGTLRQIRHLDRIPTLPGYLYHEIRGVAGAAVGLANGGFRAPLYIELLSPSAETVRESVAAIASWTDLYEVE